jgi:hypothetical protein
VAVRPFRFSSDQPAVALRTGTELLILSILYVASDDAVTADTFRRKLIVWRESGVESSTYGCCHHGEREQRFSDACMRKAAHFHRPKMSVSPTEILARALHGIDHTVQYGAYDIPIPQRNDG